MVKEGCRVGLPLFLDLVGGPLKLIDHARVSWPPVVAIADTDKAWTRLPSAVALLPLPLPPTLTR